jgi:hypothetical protein
LRTRGPWIELQAAKLQAISNNETLPPRRCMDIVEPPL